MTTSPSAKERAQEAASTAADEGRHVAGVARDEAQQVASEAAAQARGLVDEATRQLSDQVGEQGRAQRDRLVGTLQTISDDLERMAGEAGSAGLAADLAREAAQRTRALGHHLEGREPTELLDDVRSFARRRPGTFLLGALAAGVVAGRLTRGARDGMAGAVAPTTRTAGVMPPAPRAGTTSPPQPAVTPGQQTMDPAPAAGGPTTVPPTAAPPTTPTTRGTGSAFDESGPMGTDAAGYGERGALGEEQR